MSCCGAFVMPTEIMPAKIPARNLSSETPSSQSGGFRLSGRHVLWMMLGFFGVIAAVNAVMMTLAIRTMPGLGVRNSYEASQNFNAGLGMIAAQDQRGWHVEISTTGIQSGEALRVMIRDASGLAIHGLDGEARFERPTDKRKDQAFPLREKGAGIYEADIPALETGQWDLAVELLRDHQRVFVSRRRIVLNR